MRDEIDRRISMTGTPEEIKKLEESQK